MTEKKFPEGFFWGAATASYQVEGGIENCDWAEAEREGKVPVCGKACDHYNRFEEDFDIAKSLGHNAHRLSIEWSRIEPEEGKFDQKEIEHYRTVFKALRVRNIEPFVTIWHYTQPLWFSESGGFLRRDAAEVFTRYCERVVKEFGDDVTFWVTMNEPEVFAIGGYLLGICPPFHKSFFMYMRMLSSLARAHQAAYTAIKKAAPHAQVGIAKQNVWFESNANPFNRMISAFEEWFWNWRFLTRIRGYQDFIGLNQYHTRKWGATPLEKHVLVRTGFSCYYNPESLFKCLLALKHYNLPIYVLENGLNDADDVLRPLYIHNVVGCLKRAIKSKIPVKGYFHWTLLDNYEWVLGFKPRMGLVEVDFATQARTVRPSALLYKELFEAAEIGVPTSDPEKMLV